MHCIHCNAWLVKAVYNQTGVTDGSAAEEGYTSQHTFSKIHVLFVSIFLRQVIAVQQRMHLTR